MTEDFIQHPWFEPKSVTMRTSQFFFFHKKILLYLFLGLHPRAQVPKIKPSQIHVRMNQVNIDINHGMSQQWMNGLPR